MESSNRAQKILIIVAFSLLISLLGGGLFISSKPSQASFGTQEFGTIVGYVWGDINGNGNRDGGSPNQSGITIRFSGPSSIPNQTTNVTPSPGNNYGVSNIEPGQYTVTVSVPVGWRNTTPTSVNVNVPPGGVVSVNFGLQQYGGIGGYVWSDWNGNGSRDGWSENQSGITLSFSGPSAIPNQTTNSTASPGNNYGVSGILPGNYTVTVSVPPGWRNTTPTSVVVTVSAGGSATANFGIQQFGTIIGYVWNDLDGDGWYDADESNVSGVGISLSNGPSAPQNTNSDGTSFPGYNYSFSDIISGQYTLTLSVPGGWYATTPTTANFTMNPGTTSVVSFGIREGGTIQGYVWSDLNGNGSRDGTSPNQSGITLSFSGPSSIPDQITNGTASPGYNYTVSNIQPGDYTITVSVPGGWRSTSSTTVNVTVPAGGTGTANFGIQEYGTLAGFVWNDLNGNGTRDGSSPNRSGVTLSFSGPSSIPNQITNSTASPGSNYGVSGILPGDYTVTVSVPAGWRNTTNTVVAVTVPAGGTGSANFGVQQYGSIVGYVWSDLTGNGVRDGSSPNQSGITLSFSGPSSIPDQITNGTASPGNNYGVYNIIPGDYTITASVPSGWRATTSNPVTVTVGGGGTSTANFGIQQYGSISIRVFDDNGSGAGAVAENGIYEGSELLDGSGYAYMELEDPSTETGPALSFGASTTLTNVVPGQYRLELYLNNLWRITRWSLDAPGAPVSYSPSDYVVVDAGAGVYETLLFTVSPGEDTGVDLGLRALGILQGKFFIDNNSDGRYNAGDSIVTPPFTNPTVNYTSNHPSSGSANVSTADLGDGCGVGDLGYRGEDLTPTSPGGYSYNFTFDFTAANYYVTGSYFTDGAANCLGTFFASASGSGDFSYTVSGIGLDRLQTVNLWVGIRQGGTINGYVWDDYYYPEGGSRNITFDDNSGDEDEFNDEEYVSGDRTYSVELLNDSGQTIKYHYPDPGDTTGQYDFTSLVPGTYSVRVNPPLGYCSGAGSSHGSTGWTYDGSPQTYYGTGGEFKARDISVSSGTAVVNLGLMTDYDLSGNTDLGQIIPDAMHWFNFQTGPDTANCWVPNSMVEVTLEPDSNPNWDYVDWEFSCISPTACNEIPDDGSIRHNDGKFRSMEIDPNSSSFDLGLDAGSEVPDNEPLSFDLCGESSDPPRRRCLRISVVIERDPWMQVKSGDTNVNYWDGTGFTDPGIDFIIPEPGSVLGGFEEYFLADPSASNSVGGLITTRTFTQVEQIPTFDDKANEREWVIDQYENLDILSLDTKLFDSASSPDWANLDPGEIYKTSESSLPASYNLTGAGVAAVYIDTDVTINGNFLQADNDPRERVILVIDGTLTISGSVVSDPPDNAARANIEAALLVLGESAGDSIFVLDSASGNDGLKIQGVLHAQKGVNLQRELDDNHYPSFVVEFDPMYILNPVEKITTEVFTWREVQP